MLSIECVMKRRAFTCSCYVAVPPPPPPPPYLGWGSSYTYNVYYLLVPLLFDDGQSLYIAPREVTDVYIATVVDFDEFTTCE